MKRTISLLLCLLLLVGFVPLREARAAEHAITQVVATNAHSMSFQYGDNAWVDDPFKVTSGTPAQVELYGYYPFEKKEGDSWVEYTGGTLIEGTWRLSVRAYIATADGFQDSDHYYFGKPLELVVNGVSWGIDSNPSVSPDGYSYAYFYSPEFVIEAPVGTPLSFTDSYEFDIGEHKVNKAITPYSVASYVSGGTAPYVFSKTSGPNWINVSSDGTVSGTPTTAGTNSDLVIRVTDKVNNYAEITVSVGDTLPLSTDATLYTITASVSNGGGGWDHPTLSPIFAPGTNSYVVNLTTDYTTAYFYAGTNADGQTVTAKANGSTIGVSSAVNGFITDNVSLGGATTTVELTVTSEDNNHTNTYTILVNRGDGTEYAINVENGTATAGGSIVTSAVQDTWVTITANAAPTGKVFDKWVVVSGGISLGNVSQATQTFKMPANAVSVKATYKNEPTIDATLNTITASVSNGTGGWENPTLSPIYDPDTDSYVLDLTTDYTTAYFYARTNAEGQTVTAKANGSAVGVNSALSGFTTENISLGGATTTVVLTVTSQDGNHTKEYTIVIYRGDGTEYSVSVKNGTATIGSSIVTSAVQDTWVTITANEAPSGKVFDKWVVVSGGISLSNVSQMTQTFKMPANAVSVKATYKNEPTIDATLNTITASVSNGTGGWENPTLSPIYDPDTDSYVLDLTTDYTTAYFYARTNAEGQTVTAKANGSAVGVNSALSGFTTENISLGGATTTVVLTVTSQDGNHTKEYTIVIYRGDGTEYSVSVKNGTATIGSSIVTSAVQDTWVTITANAAPSGKVFDKWVVVSGGISLSNASQTTQTFKMPANAVSVEATYKTDPTIDATLKTITASVSNGTGGWENPALSPIYDPDTNSYVLNLTSDYTTAYFYAGTNAEGQTVTAKVNGSAFSVSSAVNGFQTNNISLGDTTTTVVLTVTSQDGSHTNTYTIAITRGGGITTYTVTFDANGHGTAPGAQTVVSGNTATKPADPTESGWTFGGWFKEAACTTAFDFSTIITGNITLYAKWTEESVTPPVPTTYTVFFNTNGHGTAPAAQTVESGNKATKPADPAETGWTFGSWFKEAACTTAFDFNTAITSDLTLYAKWTEESVTPPVPITYTVTFNANGHGTAPAAQTVESGNKATKPADPAESGWTFGGWFKEASCTTAFDFSTAITGNITLYAKWTEKVTATATPTPTPSSGSTVTPTPRPAPEQLLPPTPPR